MLTIYISSTGKHFSKINILSLQQSQSQSKDFSRLHSYGINIANFNTIWMAKLSTSWSMNARPEQFHTHQMIFSQSSIDQVPCSKHRWSSPSSSLFCFPLSASVLHLATLIVHPISFLTAFPAVFLFNHSSWLKMF